MGVEAGGGSGGWELMPKKQAMGVSDNWTKKWMGKEWEVRWIQEPENRWGNIKTQMGLSDENESVRYRAHEKYRSQICQKNRRDWDFLHELCHRYVPFMEILASAPMAKVHFKEQGLYTLHPSVHR